MIFYDGTYRLQRQANIRKRSVVRRGSAWRIRIINFAMSQPAVRHLKPIAIVATQTADGILKKTCAESIGRRICRDFRLKLKEILWIEHDPDAPWKMNVAIFNPIATTGMEAHYSIKWRPIRSNEIEAISAFIPEAGKTETF
ncbi:hypothetical protein ACFL9U_06960 [Thermodesulfobacteriota bacterium]